MHKILFANIKKETFPKKVKNRGQDLKGSQQIAKCFNCHFSSIFLADNSGIVPETAQPEIFLGDMTFNANYRQKNISHIKSNLMIR